MLSSAGRSGRCAACRKCLQCKRNGFFSIRLTAFFFVKKAGPPGFPLPCPFLLGKERCGGTAPKKNTFFRYARLSTRKRFRKEKPLVSPSFGPGSQAPQARILSRLYYGPTFNICLAKYKSPNKRSIFPFTERESVRFKTVIVGWLKFVRIAEGKCRLRPSFRARRAENRGSSGALLAARKKILTRAWTAGFKAPEKLFSRYCRVDLPCAGC